MQPKPYKIHCVKGENKMKQYLLKLIYQGLVIIQLLPNDVLEFAPNDKGILVYLNGETFIIRVERY